MQRKAKIFMNKRSQAVRLPKEFQFRTQEVFIRKEGSEVVLSPRPFDWTSYLTEAPVASAGFMEEVEDLPVQERVMPRYMMDTDICSYVMKRSNDLLLKRLQKVPVSEVCVSVITKSELLYGVEVSASCIL